LSTKELFGTSQYVRLFDNPTPTQGRFEASVSSISTIETCNSKVFNLKNLKIHHFTPSKTPFLITVREC
jgi:hypothetical protein